MGVETVINFDMPTQLTLYLHRVGRTARAGKRGRSVTLIGEGDRKQLKHALKHKKGEDHIRHRVVPPDVIAECMETMKNISSKVAARLESEKEEKAIRKAEMEIKKHQNMVDHHEEIFSRPARVWFQSSEQKDKDASMCANLHAWFLYCSLLTPLKGIDHRKSKSSNDLETASKVRCRGALYMTSTLIILRS